ncbi:MAG: NAD(P)-dependent oxidoreductase [Chitinophagales bacterium]
MKIGIIRETKTPPDSRVPLTPLQCKNLLAEYNNLDIVIQSSTGRCYKDEEYKAQGIVFQEDMNDCDVLMGVKEVKKSTLIADKTYFFFSHTIKAQPYNRDLLQLVLEKNIQLIDYETICNEKGSRVIAFGRWAGIVGAHNGILTWGRRTGNFELKTMNQCHDFAEAKSLYNNLPLGNPKIVLTGTGRVSNGSAEVLDEMGIRKINAEDFLTKKYDEAVYCQLKTNQLFAKGENNDFDSEFYNNPTDYHSIFAPYTQVADIMINGIYWDNKAPAFFSKEDMKKDDFTIKVIADITCDIAPEASIPATLKASTIPDPIFGYNVQEENECYPHKDGVVDMMTVDNLPNELPRDASEDFGRQFSTYVLPELIKENSEMIHKASITKNGKLNEPYLYLTDYVNGK